MRLLRYGSLGSEKPGLLDRVGVIRDLSAHVPDITAETMTPAGLARLAALDPESLPVVPGTPRFGVPVRNIGKFIAIGLAVIAGGGLLYYATKSSSGKSSPRARTPKILVATPARATPARASRLPSRAPFPSSSSSFPSSRGGARI